MNKGKLFLLLACLALPVTSAHAAPTTCQEWLEKRKTLVDWLHLTYYAMGAVQSAAQYGVIGESKTMDDYLPWIDAWCAEHLGSPFDVAVFTYIDELRTQTTTD